MKPLSVAVIGAGHLGRIHARILASLAGYELVAIVDPVEAARRELADTYGCKALGHFGEVLGRVDAAIVATPTRKHHEVGEQLLRHGVHCFIEKPIANSVREAEELIETARTHAVVLQVGHVERFNPAFALALGECPQPKYIEARRLSTFRFRSTDIGVVQDLMIHDIDLVLALVRSRLRHVEALGISVFGDSEDIAQARLVFENGCVAQLTASRASFQAVRQLQVFGEQGFVGLDLATRSGTVVKPCAALGQRQFHVSTLSAPEIDRLKDRVFEDLLPMAHFQAPAQDQITAELEDFAESIAAGRRPRVTGEAGRDALAVADQVLAAIARHAWDGTPDGRVGAFALPAHERLRGPHWHRMPAADSARRQAG